MAPALAHAQPHGRRELLRNDAVLFAGYAVEHPLVHNVKIKVQTKRESTPEQAMEQAISDSMGRLDALKRAFEVRCARALRPPTVIARPRTQSQLQGIRHAQLDAEYRARDY